MAAGLDSFKPICIRYIYAINPSAPRHLMATGAPLAQWLELNKGSRGGMPGAAGKATVRIILQDSYKLLPLSLPELGKVLAVETQKGVGKYRCRAV
jgi:hypothetical protein